MSGPSLRIGGWLARLRTRLYPDFRALSEDESTQLLLIGGIVGTLAGLAVGGMDALIVLFSELFLGSDRPSVGGIPLWRLALGPIIGGAVSGLLIRYLTRTQRPSGIPDVIDATWDANGRLSLRDGIVTGISAAAAIGSGHSGGREGPAVQLGGSVASFLCHRIGLPARRSRVLVAAGAAAGIAASFNTPVGAAFFAMEVVLGNFAMEMFGPVVAATVMGTVMGQALLGDRVALHLPDATMGPTSSLPFFLGLGALAGLVAVALKRAITGMDALFSQRRLPPALRPILAGVGVGTLGAAGLSPIMGNGAAYLGQLLRGEASEPIAILALVLAAKVAATGLTFAGRTGAGIFMPSLFVGGITGMLYGEVATLLFPDVVGPTIPYGIVGMAAVTASVTHAPLTMILMLFEMTRSYEVILPLLLCLSMTGLVSSSLGSESIYLTLLRLRGRRIDRTREELVMHDLRVTDLMREDELPVLNADAGVPGLVAAFLQSPAVQVFVVDADRHYLGTIHIQAAKEHLHSATDNLQLSELFSRDVPSLRPEQTLAEVLPLFFRADLDELPVLDAENRLQGTLRERHVMGAYHREVLRKDALLARVRSGTGETRQDDFFELPPGQVMRSVKVDRDLGRRTLAELALPRRFGCTVLAVVSHDPDGRERRLPASAEQTLSRGDRLIVVGPSPSIDTLTEALLPPAPATPAGR